MPKRRYEQREPTHDWQQIRPLLKDSAQITYEVIRPVILGWETPKERSAETGMPMRSFYYTELPLVSWSRERFEVYYSKKVGEQG
jgi:hypothetical protein